MSKDIKLSPKHGVNPTIPCCFWCGEQKNEIALLGKIDKQDSEAPKNLIINYEPCYKCKNIFDKGIHVIGAVETPINNFPRIAGDEHCSMYPTGTFFVGIPDAIANMLRYNGLDHMVDNVLKTKKLVMPEKVVLEIINSLKEE